MKDEKPPGANQALKDMQGEGWDKMVEYAKAVEAESTNNGKVAQVQSTELEKMLAQAPEEWKTDVKNKLNERVTGGQPLDDAFLATLFSVTTGDKSKVQLVFSLCAWKFNC